MPRMRTTGLIVAMSAFVHTHAAAEAPFVSTADLARQTVAETRRMLLECGFEERLPWGANRRPQRFAHVEYVRHDARILYEEEDIGSVVFTAANGGWVHRIAFDSDELSFTTPRGGVAKLKRAHNAWGPFYVMQCFTRAGRFFARSLGEFEGCVRQQWMASIGVPLGCDPRREANQGR